MSIINNALRKLAAEDEKKNVGKEAPVEFQAPSTLGEQVALNGAVMTAGGLGKAYRDLLRNQLAYKDMVLQNIGNIRTSHLMNPVPSPAAVSAVATANELTASPTASKALFAPHHEGMLRRLSKYSLPPEVTNRVAVNAGALRHHSKNTFDRLIESLDSARVAQNNLLQGRLLQPNTYRTGMPSFRKSFLKGAGLAGAVSIPLTVAVGAVRNARARKAYKEQLEANGYTDI